MEQLHKIFKLCGSPSEDYWRKSRLPHATIFKPQQPYRRCVADTFKDFPAPALALIETLLSIDPADRGSAALALKSEVCSCRTVIIIDYLVLIMFVTYLCVCSPPYLSVSRHF